MKKKGLIIILSAVVIAVTMAVIAMFATGKARIDLVCGVKAEKWDYKSEEVSENEIQIMNTCYSYIEKYLGNELPADTKELAEINKNISEVMNNKLFYKAYEESDFQEALKYEKSFYKNGGMYDESYMKESDYGSLVVIKLRCFLLLDRFEEYKNCYIENANTLLMFTDYFPRYLAKDSETVDSAPRLKVVMDTYDELLSISDNTIDKYLILSTASRMYSFENADESKRKEFGDLMNEAVNTDEVQRHIMSGKLWSGLSNEKLNPKGETVYMHLKFFIINTTQTAI